MPRQRCAYCQRASAACVCTFVARQENHIPIVVLQHPDEAHRPLGTVRIMALGLSHVSVFVGVDFNPAILGDGLGEPYQRPLLLYKQKNSSAPSGEHRTDSCVPEHISVDVSKPEQFSETSRIKGDAIVLLDGTWRNTREMLLRNPWLQALPTVSLLNPPASKYRIRKARQNDGLASIEAVALLLSKMQSGFDADKLLRPFTAMIEYQIARMGPATFQKNYR